MCEEPANGHITRVVWILLWTKVMEFTDMFGFLELQDGDREELRQLKKATRPRQ
jgi:hypothetical protein